MVYYKKKEIMPNPIESKSISSTSENMTFTQFLVILRAYLAEVQNLPSISPHSHSLLGQMLHSAEILTQQNED